MRSSFIALSIGFIMDLCIGDPVYCWHPIRLIGRVIGKTEKIMRKLFPKTSGGEYLAGLFLVVIIVAIAFLFPFLFLLIIYRMNWIAGIIVESILCYQMLATKSLKSESMKVYHSLKNKNIPDGRAQVAMLVGRDTDKLQEDGIIRATVETIAENTSDGSIAPLFYMAIGGAVGGVLYKAVNTMDSMVGYKNDSYLFFGRTAAKLDDVFNFIPARIAAGLMIIATALCGFRVNHAWRIFQRDRYHHASPNSAQTEAVMAGALGIRLGGDAFYFGKLVEKKTIGDSDREIECEDIKKANRLLYLTSFLGILLFGGLKYLLIHQLIVEGIV